MAGDMFFLPANKLTRHQRYMKEQPAGHVLLRRVSQRVAMLMKLKIVVEPSLARVT